MNIISKYRDYYDAVGHMYGSYNEGNTFVRHCYIKEESRLSDGPALTHPNIGTSLNINFGTLGFCGKLYKCIRFTTVKKHMQQWGTSFSIEHETILWSAEQALDYITNLALSDDDTKELNRVLSKRFYLKGHFNYMHGNPLDIKRPLEYYFKDPTVKNSDELFKESPIFWRGFASFDNIKQSSPIYMPSECMNPYLAGIHFGRIKSSEQAYQELEMWLGRKDQEYSDPNAGISDEHLAAGKGYNCMSFKKRGPKSSCSSKRNTK